MNIHEVGAVGSHRRWEQRIESDDRLPAASMAGHGVWGGRKASVSLELCIR
jgi:hypothetical protein